MSDRNRSRMRLQSKVLSSRRALAGILLFAPLLIPALAGRADVTPAQKAEAAKLNNFGTALMNQQLLDKAQAKFGEAYALDPALVQAEVNRGIALIYLQKMPEAKQALEHAATQNAERPPYLVRAGYLAPHRCGVPASPGKFSEGSSPGSRRCGYPLLSRFRLPRTPSTGPGSHRVSDGFAAQPNSRIGTVRLSKSAAAAGPARRGDHCFQAL